MSAENVQCGPDTQSSEIVVSADPIRRAVGELAVGRLVVYDNFSVYAGVGNANSPTLLDDVRKLKHADHSRQAMGWMTSFEQGLPLVDVTSTDNPNIKYLLENPDELTNLIGGLGFLRARADMQAKTERGIPDILIPDHLRTVQIYSPEGNVITAKLTELARKAGVEPAITSLNFQGEPEIVREDEARRFAAAADTGVFTVVNASDDRKPARPLGSYPSIFVHREGIEIIRLGCFAQDILQNVFSGYKLAVAPVNRVETSKYPQNQLRMQDLPKDVRKLRGPELRLGVLATLGWG